MLTNKHSIFEFRVFCAAMFASCAYIIYHEFVRARKPRPVAIAVSDTGLLFTFDKNEGQHDVKWDHVVSLAYLMGAKYEGDHIEIPIGISLRVDFGEDGIHTYALLDGNWKTTDDDKISDLIPTIPQLQEKLTAK